MSESLDVARARFHSLVGYHVAHKDDLCGLNFRFLSRGPRDHDFGLLPQRGRLGPRQGYRQLCSTHLAFPQGPLVYIIRIPPEHNCHKESGASNIDLMAFAWAHLLAQPG